MEKFFLFNGKETEEKTLVPEHFKRGFLYGDGIFETMFALNYRIFRWERHAERLLQGLKRCNMLPPDNLRAIKEKTEHCLEKLGIEKACLRFNVWRRETEKFDPGEERRCHTLLTAKKYIPYKSDYYSKGMVCCVGKSVFKNEKSPLTYIKSFNYLENILAKNEARQEGCDEIILINGKGMLAESSVANIFLREEDTLYTPSEECGILKGVTRDAIIEICRNKGVPVKEGVYGTALLRNSCEIFMTNTLMGIMPVKTVKGFFESSSFEFSSILSKELKKLEEKETAD